MQHDDAHGDDHRVERPFPTMPQGPSREHGRLCGRMNATIAERLRCPSRRRCRRPESTPRRRTACFAGGCPAQADAKTALQNAGIDGALVASMKRIEERTVPGGYSGSFWGGYYGPGWGGGWDPGYVIPDQLVKFETSLWSLGDQGSIVWSAATETQNPSSGKDFARVSPTASVPALAEAGFLPR